jgi:hypothetical protein
LQRPYWIEKPLRLLILATVLGKLGAQREDDKKITKDDVRLLAKGQSPNADIRIPRKAALTPEAPLLITSLALALRPSLAPLNPRSKDSLLKDIDSGTVKALTRDVQDWVARYVKEVPRLREINVLSEKASKLVAILESWAGDEYPSDVAAAGQDLMSVTGDSLDLAALMSALGRAVTKIDALEWAVANEAAVHIALDSLRDTFSAERIDALVEAVARAQEQEQRETGERPSTEGGRPARKVGATSREPQTEGGADEAGRQNGEVEKVALPQRTRPPTIRRSQARKVADNARRFAKNMPKQASVPTEEFDAALWDGVTD